MIKIILKDIKITVDRGAATRVARIEAIRRINDYCRKTLNQAIVDCPVDTGNLRAHHRMKVRASSTRVVGQVYNDANYAAAVHDGSAPHTIRGRRMRKMTKGSKRRGPKALRFVINGEVVFRRSVRHPGSSGKPWLRDAARKTAASEGFLWTPGSGGQA
jgi:hypothetical protein